MYTDRTRDDILDAMLESVRDDVDKREGSVVHDMLAPPAEEFELMGFILEAILENGFIDTAQGEFIDRRANELGVYRKPAEFATGRLLIEDEPGTEIEVGTEIVAQFGDGTQTLSTTEYVVIPESGEVEVEVTAVTAGSAGNISEGSSLTSEDYDFESITISEPLTGGIDVEPDHEFKERYLHSVRKPITSGNVHHYEKWARDIAGISGARVQPLWDGNGTVKVVVIDAEGRAPSPEKVEEVAAYIESERPIGADVTVVPITEIPIVISARLTLEGDLTVSDIKDRVTESIANYLAQTDSEARYSEIAKAVLTTDGVLDYDNLLIGVEGEELGASNIPISNEDVAVVGEVTLE